MKALSVRQPWPWAMWHAGKGVENRSWYTAFRGQMLIHAGKQLDKDAWFSAMPDQSWYDADRDCIVRAAELPLGAIVGVVTVVGCLPLIRVPKDQAEWACGPYCWMIGSPRVPRTDPLGWHAWPHGRAL